MRKPNMIRRIFYLSKRQDDKLRARAKETGLSQAELVRRALDEYFARHAPDNNASRPLPPPATKLGERW